MTDKALFWRAQLYELQKSSSQVEQFVVPKLRVLFIGDSIIGSFPVKSMISQERVQPVIMEILPVTSRFLLPFTKSITLPTGSNVKQVSDLVRKVNRGLKELCREHSAQLVPTYGLFVSEQGEASRDLMQAGGYYVNIFGYGKIADGIHAELKKLSGNKGSLDSRL